MQLIVMSQTKFLSDLIANHQAFKNIFTTRCMLERVQFNLFVDVDLQSIYKGRECKNYMYLPRLQEEISYNDTSIYERWWKKLCTNDTVWTNSHGESYVLMVQYGQQMRYKEKTNQHSNDSKIGEIEA